LPTPLSIAIETLAAYLNEIFNMDLIITNTGKMVNMMKLTFLCGEDNFVDTEEGDGRM
jgi:hypothetical protein